MYFSKRYKIHQISNNKKNVSQVVLSFHNLINILGLKKLFCMIYDKLRPKLSNNDVPPCSKPFHFQYQSRLMKDQ